MELISRYFGVERMLPSKMRGGELPSTKSMYREYGRLALPSVAEMVLMSAIGMADTVMVSVVGTDAVAAVGLVGQPRMLLLSIFFALNVGITAVVARRKGEGRREEANQVLRNAILVVTALSVLIMALALPFSRELMIFAKAEPGVTLEYATDYFRILTYALPFNVLAMGICAAQRGIGNTKLTMYVNITSNLVNVLFNWLLINGIGPFPRLEVRGAAIATGIGMFVGFVLSVLSLINGRKRDSFLSISLHDSWRIKKKSIQDIMKVSSGAMIEQVAMRVGFFSYALIIASLKSDATAAHFIAMQFLNISFCFADGLAVASTSLVGQMLGRARKDLSYIYGTIAQRIAILVAIAIGTICIVFRAPLVGMFIKTGDGENVRMLAEMVMIVVGIFQPFQMLAVVISGALRGAGDVKYTARVMLLTVSIMRPLLALLATYFLGTVLGLGEKALVGAWCAALV
ncbi:MAG: MATE family efflux transporter, partial [Christensenellales bacterium]